MFITDVIRQNESAMNSATYESGTFHQSNREKKKLKKLITLYSIAYSTPT